MDKHDGMNPHLEQNILGCEVKLELGRITINKATEDDRIPSELFKILKGDAIKCCIHYVRKSGKLNNSHRTGKD